MRSALLIILLIAITLESSNCQRTPSISYISQEQIKDIGGSVELDCSVQYARDYTVVWIKTRRHRSDYVFLSTGSSLVLRDSRFSLKYTESSSTYTLQIRDIQETDDGIYQCRTSTYFSFHLIITFSVRNFLI